MQLVSQQYPTKRLEVWFQDESRVGQQGRLTRIWGRKGERVRIPKDMRFESTFIYGAVCPERDIGEALVVNEVSKKVMERHLQDISRRIPEGGHAVILLDRASWHKRPALPSNITLIHLPPYSPELNACENIWEYLKNTFLSNLVFETLENLTDACCAAWNKLTQEKGRIRSIASRNWILNTQSF